jgi:hypothetical protein
MMPVEVSWYISNRVVLARGYGSVTTEENAESDRQVAALIDQGIAPVHVIIDVTTVDDFPFFSASYQKDNVQQFLRSNKLGWGVVCGTSNRVVRFVGEVVARLSRINFRMFPTLEEGLAFLKDQDQTVPWNTAYLQE